MGNGRKQHMSHEDFVAMYRNIADLVSPRELDQLVAKTLVEIAAVCRGRKVASGWSGGKDSLVLYDLLQQLGLRQAVMVITRLEYPEFLRWVTDHMPPELDVINTGQDLAWLAAHPAMLFPPSANIARKWFQVVQTRGLAQYFASEQLDLLVLGRRRDDGNNCGDAAGFYTTPGGITKYAPLRDWAQEHVMAYLFYHSVPLPPLYGWPRGFRVGSGPWPARQWCTDERHGWSEVWQIDRAIVRAAAELLPGARAFLSDRG